MPSDFGNLITDKIEKKDLGIVIDSKFNFRKHISNEVITAKRNLGIFRTFIYIKHVLKSV